MAIETASKVGTFCLIRTGAPSQPSKRPAKWTHLHCCIVCCCLGGRQGDTERVVAQWRRPVASGVALGMQHWSMPHESLQRLRMAIKMACGGGTFAHHHRFFA